MKIGMQFVRSHFHLLKSGLVNRWASFVPFASFRGNLLLLEYRGLVVDAIPHHKGAF